jgi:glycosyltransferase involved in cell wall biosynthesis
LGFLGRLEHTQKGVLHIPKIIQEINKLAVNYKLTIAGKGRHQKQMEEELKEEVESGKVEFIGAISNKKVPEFLSKVDLFLFTSHFEGCPNALLEAMMAGCVPISWNIHGITDYIIDDNETGFLIDAGNYKAYARTIYQLNSDRELIKRMSQKAIAVSRKRFTSVITAKKYAKLFAKVIAQPPVKTRTKSWARFKVNENFRKTWKDYIPITIKYKIKTVING